MSSLLFGENVNSTLKYKDHPRPLEVSVEDLRGYMWTYSANMWTFKYGVGWSINTLSNVCLLSTLSAEFAKLLAQILKAHHPDCPIKLIRLDNDEQVYVTNFRWLLQSVGIEVKHPVPYIHTVIIEGAPRFWSLFGAMQFCLQLYWSVWGPPLPNPFHHCNWLLAIRMTPHIYMCLGMQFMCQ